MNEIIYALDRESLSGTSRSQLVEMARAAGCDGIEIPADPDFLSGGPAASEELLSLLHDAGLSAPVMALFRPSAIDETELKSFLQTLHALEPLSRAAAVRLFVLRVESDGQIVRDEALKTLGGSLIAAYNHFDPLGIAVAVELCDEGLLGPYTEAMDWLYMHNPEAGVAIDTRCLAEADSSPYRAAVEMKALVRMVYLSEPLASSRFYYSHLFSGMKAEGYAGPLALRPRMLTGENPAETVAELRKLWELAPVEQAALTES